MSGRSEEFREFARDRAWPLQQSAYLLCGDWHCAQDVVQETLIKAYRHWPRVKRADSPDAYVRGILLNEVRDRWRRPDKAVPVAQFGAAHSRRGRRLPPPRPAAAGAARAPPPAAHDGRPALPRGHDPGRDGEGPRVQRGPRQEPELAGARHLAELSYPDGVKAMKSPEETQLSD